MGHIEKPRKSNDQVSLCKTFKHFILKQSQTYRKSHWYNFVSCNHLRGSCQSDVHYLPNILMYGIPKIKNTLQHTHNTTIGFYHLFLDFIQVLPIISITVHTAKGSNSESQVAFSCHVSLLSFNLEQFLSLY